MRQSWAMQYQCTRCDQIHDGIPALVAAAPLYYFGIPENERGERCRLDGETCLVDDEAFFVRGCLEIPIIGESELLSLGLWASLSKPNFSRFRELLGEPCRSSHGPFLGWLSASVKGFPDCENIKTRVHLRDDGRRPLLELEPTDHPLAMAQRNGITTEHVSRVLADYLHQTCAG